LKVKSELNVAQNLKTMSVTVLEKVKEKTFTLEEYFKREEKTKYKNEFQNGKIIPMAGGTISHGKIGGNVHFYLRTMLNDGAKNCEVFNSDQKIFIPAFNHIVYSDTFVVKGKLETYKGGNQAILNPTLVVEVSSDSTAGYDRRGKFRKYQSLASFQEYLLVDQETTMVDVLFRLKNGEWRMKSYVGLDAVIHLQSIDCELKMADIYENIPDLKDPQTVLEFDPEAE